MLIYTVFRNEVGQYFYDAQLLDKFEKDLVPVGQGIGEIVRVNSML